MVHPTARQLARYYEIHREIDVIFTKEVIRTLGLLTKNVYLKHRGQQIPCVVYSSSMCGAKIVANVKSETFLRIHDSRGVLSLRFSFEQFDKPYPLSFYVPCKIAGYSPYGQNNQELNFVSLAYPQRPSDDLIALLGSLLETNINIKRRKEERIVVTPDTAPKLGLKQKDAVVYIENVARKCIVRDLSFSGARLIVPGRDRLLLEKSAVLQLDLEDEPHGLKIQGKIIRIEGVTDHDDIAAIAVLFDEGEVPLTYKMRISEYLTALGHGPKATTTEA